VIEVKKINLKKLHEMMTGGIAGIINMNSTGPYGDNSTEEGVTKPKSYKKINIIKKPFPHNKKK
jgi:hypothetical protein